MNCIKKFILVQWKIWYGHRDKILLLFNILLRQNVTQFSQNPPTHQKRRDQEISWTPLFARLLQRYENPRQWNNGTPFDVLTVLSHIHMTFQFLSSHDLSEITNCNTIPSLIAMIQVKMREISSLIKKMLKY